MISNTSKSLLVYPNKCRQQTSTYYQENNIEEEETASVYLLIPDSEQQTEKMSNLEKENYSEKSIHTQQSEQIIKSIQPRKPIQLISNTSNSLLVHPNKTLQQSNSYCNAKNMEEETASEYLLIDESDKETEKTNKTEKSVHTQQSERSIKSRQTNKTNQLNSINTNKIYQNQQNKSQQQSNVFKSKNMEEETASEYLLVDESDKETEKSVHTQQSERSIKSRQTNKTNQQPSANTNKLYQVHPNKTLQQSNSYWNTKNMEEETASEYLLVDESDKETEKTNKTEKSVHTQQSERNIKSRQTNKTNQQPSANKLQPHKIQQPPDTTNLNEAAEEDLASEFLLQDDSESEFKRPRSEPKIEDTKSSTQISVHEPETLKSMNSSPRTKNAVTTSTYDPSIFYAPQQQEALSSTPIRHSRFSYKIPLTVTLKDIGLEGLDSATIEKFDENDKKNADQKKLKKRTHKNESGKDKRKQSDVVVCKINSFVSPSSSQSFSSAKKSSKNYSGRKVVEPISPCENADVTKPKCGSLLDSTQKQKRSQTIKPKTHSKTRKSSKKSEKI